MRNHKLAPIVASSSSKNNNKPEQPHLSGAYIRSLVKQLSSSSSSATCRSKDHHGAMGSKPHAGGQPENHQPQAQTIAPPQQQQPHKKQVRRRLHTSRPYQERLLNMAEARREIVTALKIHRASMRQAKEQQQQQQQMMQQLHLQQQQQQEVQDATGLSSAIGGGGAPLPMSYSSYSDYLYNSPIPHFTAPPTSYSSQLTYHTPVAPPILSNSELDFGHQLAPLPAQTLGLNLSFQGFSSADTKNSTGSSIDPPLLQPSPASSYSVYSSPSVTKASNDLSAVATTENTSLPVDASLHRVLDDEEMAAIYSIGEQHDIEWSDTVNLVTSAWWSKLLESVEGKGNGTMEQEAARGSASTNTAAAEDPLSLAAEMPDWFSNRHQATKESNSDVLGVHLMGDYYNHNEDVTFPQMDMGEFEGWDAEWFS